MKTSISSRHACSSAVLLQEHTYRYSPKKKTGEKPGIRQYVVLKAKEISITYYWQERIIAFGERKPNFQPRFQALSYLGFLGLVFRALFYAEKNRHSCKDTKMATRLILTGACRARKLASLLKHVIRREQVVWDRLCAGSLDLWISFHSVAVGFTILCSQR